MGQERKSNYDSKLWAALSRVEIQRGMLEKWIDSELDEDMEAWPSYCRAIDNKMARTLTSMDGIQAKTALTGNRKKGIMKHLDRIIEKLKTQQIIGE